MRKRLFLAVFALIGLGTFVVLGSSPNFVGTMVESLRQNTLTQIFSPVNRAEDIIKKAGRSKRVSREDEMRKVETPETMLWHIVFDFTKKIQIKSEESIQQGQDGSLYSDYFIRQGPLSADNDGPPQRNRQPILRRDQSVRPAGKDNS